MYDAAIGKWHVVDAVSESYFSYSPYNYVRNNPIMRIDPNGNWDVNIHVYNDREQYGYGIAIVTDRHGEEVFRFNVRAEGTGGRDRNVDKADTPLGVYDIPNSNSWINGGSRKSYGPNYRLVMNGEPGEIIDTGRDLIRIHGGRQEVYNETTKKWEPVEDATLKKTWGCLRASEQDMIAFKLATDILEALDEEEFGGKVTITDDLVRNEEHKGAPYSADETVVTYHAPGENATEEEKNVWNELVTNLLNGN